MEKKELTNDIVEIEGVKTQAERIVDDYVVTYKPHGNYHKGLDVNEVVYDLMIIAAYDQLKVGQAVYAGEYTAAEMAGTFGGMHQFMEGEDCKTIGIKTETFCCSYHAGEAFAQMAEWEGVMSLAPKKYHRFAVEGKEMPKDVKLKPYQRCHGYKPKTVSLAAENDRIAKKFAVLGPMAQSLTSEGMRRALSVIEAVKQFKHEPYYIYDIAPQMMRRKLWDDYGVKGGIGPVSYCEKDFEYGPDIWKRVDKEYVKVLVDYFRSVLANYPAPEWLKEGIHVQFKNQENILKKYRGKFYVDGMEAKADYSGRIEWWAVIKMDRYKTEMHPASRLEPWTEPEKPKKKTSGKKSAKPAASHEVAAPSNEMAAPSNEVAELSLEERLRAALLKQLRMAA